VTYPRRPGRPTASMIHELRMIAQTFMRHRTHAAIFTQKSSSQDLMCVPCKRTSNMMKKAVFIENGKSVCTDHLH